MWSLLVYFHSETAVQAAVYTIAQVKPEEPCKREMEDYTSKVCDIRAHATYLIAVYVTKQVRNIGNGLGTVRRIDSSQTIVNIKQQFSVMYPGVCSG